MKALSIAFGLLTKEEKRKALLLLPLIVLSGLADMLSVAIVFPFLSILNEPELVESNKYISFVYRIGGFGNVDDFIVFIGIGFAVFLIIASFFKIAVIYIANRWLQGRVHSFSRRLLRGYLAQPYQLTLSKNSSELIAVMLTETNRVVSQVFRAFSEFVVSLVTLVFMIALLVLVNPGITFLAIGTFSILYAILLISVRKVSSKLGKTILDANRQRHRLAWEALAGGKQVRLLNREQVLMDRFSKHSARFARATAASNTVLSSPRHLIEAVAIGGTVLLTVYFVVRSGGVASTAVSGYLPTLGVFVLAAYRMMPAFQKGYNAAVSFRLSSAAAESISADFEAALDLPRLPPRVVERMPFTESIEFRNVSYRYPGAESDSLKNVNLTIERGMSVGIVGRTGSGKTTLMDLILCLLEPTDGEILIDGRRLRHEDVRKWRRSVGYVQQDLFLSDATIAENIAFGVPVDEIDEAQVVRAAKTAQIHSYIRGLPDGYATEVGEGGVRLSGGQRQRISIARALYTNPEIIVFDEATSALDNATEALVMRAISELMGQRTLIMVAHRQATVSDCDKIISLEEGQMVFEGSYRDFLRASA